MSQYSASPPIRLRETNPSVSRTDSFQRNPWPSCLTSLSRVRHTAALKFIIVPDYRFNPPVGSFQTVDFAAMTFPAELRFDYVRVWQRKGLQNGVGCDPPSKFGYLPTFFRHWNNLCRSADGEVYQRVSLSILRTDNSTHWSSVATWRLIPVCDGLLFIA